MCTLKLVGGKLVVGVEKVTYSGYAIVDDMLHLDLEDVELQTEDWNEEVEYNDEYPEVHVDADINIIEEEKQREITPFEEFDSNPDFYNMKL